MTIIHHLKTVECFWDDVASGRKMFEVRRNDRDYKVGDVLALYRGIEERPFEPVLHRTVCYVMQGGWFGIEEGYVVLGLRAEDET